MLKGTAQKRSLTQSLPKEVRDELRKQDARAAKLLRELVDARTGRPDARKPKLYSLDD